MVQALFFAIIWGPVELPGGHFWAAITGSWGEGEGRATKVKRRAHQLWKTSGKGGCPKLHTFIMVQMCMVGRLPGKTLKHQSGD
jgi:hypothetical protein